MTNHLSLRLKIKELLIGIQESKAVDRFQGLLFLEFNNKMKLGDQPKNFRTI